MKSHINEISNESDADKPLINHPLFTGNVRPVTNLIYEYVFQAESKWLNNTFTFFNAPSLKWEILMLVYYASPLEQVEVRVLEAHARKERHLPDTLIEAIIQAYKNGDTTSINQKEGTLIFEGMAEKLLALYEKLYPETFVDALVKIRLAVPIEEVREKFNHQKVTEVFNTVIKPDLNSVPTIETFLEWANKTSAINQLHVIYLAIYEFYNRNRDIPKVDDEDIGGWYGVLASQFCNEVIGQLQRNLTSPWMRRIILTEPRDEVTRKIDTDSADFFIPPFDKSEPDDPDLELGINFSYLNISSMSAHERSVIFQRLFDITMSHIKNIQILHNNCPQNKNTNRVGA